MHRQVTEMILNFIRRRFPVDCNWMNGNCFHFACILKEVFTDGDIYYDQIEGHFTYYDNEAQEFFDWQGVHIYSDQERAKLVKWHDMVKYDSKLAYRIMRDCII